MTKYRDYLSSDAQVPEAKPARTTPDVVRAWLAPMTPDMESYLGVAEADDMWSLTVEDSSGPHNETGLFDELVHEAESRGATEYYVWSPLERTFRLAPTANVQPVP